MASSFLNKIGKSRTELNEVAKTPIGKLVAEFAENAIEEMKGDVQTASGSLRSSIAFNFNSDAKTVSVEFLANDYWDYLNSGVDGTEKSAGAVENQFGETYSFADKTPPPSAFDIGGPGKQNWMSSKGITSMTYNGVTKQLKTDADYKSAAYVIARAVKRKGIEPSEFANKALSEEKLDAFEEVIMDAFENML